MKHNLTFLFFIVMILVISCNDCSKYRNNEQIEYILKLHEEEYKRKFIIATDETKSILQGKWFVGNTIGYSQEYIITGGALDNARINISEKLITIEYESSLVPIIREYKEPVYAYYNESIEQMANDKMLGNYSGVSSLDPKTIGTVVIVMSIWNESENPDQYELCPLSFIIVKNYVIAIYQHSFFQLTKI